MWGERRFNSKHSQPWHLMEVSGQLHVLAAFNPRETNPRYPSKTDCVDPRESLNTFKSRKSLASCGNQTVIFQLLNSSQVVTQTAPYT
jgi:hypothetical protein